jgi:hypothetical protein
LAGGGVVKPSPRQLERLADLFSVAYRNCAGGLPQALELVIAEADRMRWPNERSVAIIDSVVLEHVVTATATAHRVTRGRILGPSQNRSLTEARHECWTILARLGYSLRAIGKAFDSDHSGVRAAINRYERVMASSAAVRARVAWMSKGGKRAVWKRKRNSGNSKQEVA